MGWSSHDKEFSHNNVAGRRRSCDYVRLHIIFLRFAHSVCVGVCLVLSVVARLLPGWRGINHTVRFVSRQRQIAWLIIYLDVL